MGNTSGAKFKHFLYNVSWTRKKSGEKEKNAVNRYILILKKEAKVGSTDKWVYKTKLHAQERLKKFGISKEKVKGIFDKKGLTDLVKYI